LNRYPAEDVILTNSNAGGNEHPITDEFVDWYSANIHPVVRINAIVADIWETPGFAETKGLDGSAPLDFGTMMLLKGRGPSRKAQFCTELLKLKPQRRWMRQAFGPGGEYDGCDFVRYAGVRRDESSKRKETPFEQWDEWYDCDLRHPIADWTKKMCFDYVEAHGEQFNPLYKMGFSRVGCAPCINAGKQDILNWATRFPEMIDKIRGWEQMCDEKSQRGVTFCPPLIPGQELNKIDDVVEWAKTSRGGRQQPFPIFHEREACESKYGLCE
jgi:3'-phosphoadenosine 5'-phosphosulfate sulfotransferase (PAPS reductase)/FAD synthetase